MAERRDFVQETIDWMLSAAAQCDSVYTKLKSGEISVAEFEKVYRQRLNHLLDELKDEIVHPNNSTKYVLDDGTELSPGTYDDED